MVVIVLLFTIFEAQWFYLIDYDKVANECRTTSETTRKFADIYKHFDALFYAYLPIGLMVVFNTAILVKFGFVKQQTQENKVSNFSLSKVAKGTTIMLVVTSFLSIILTLPYAIFYNMQLSMSTYVYAIVLLLLYCNHSFDIIVYGFTSSQFRRELLKLCPCRKKIRKIQPFNASQLDQSNL